jgi:hypothetical protein
VVSLHQSYLDVVREFIGKNDVSVLAADLVFASPGDTPALLRDDGIHLTNKGHRVMGAVLAEQIRSGAGGDGTAAPALLDSARRTFVKEIQPKLKTVSLLETMRATGLSRTYCGMIRRGVRVPHPRHGGALRRLVTPPGS